MFLSYRIRKLPSKQQEQEYLFLLPEQQDNAVTQAAKER